MYVVNGLKLKMKICSFVQRSFITEFKHLETVAEKKLPFFFPWKFYKQKCDES